MNDRSLILPSIRRNLLLTLYVSLGTIFLICFLSLIGWIFELPILKGFSRHWSPMMPATVICFILSVVALVFIAIEPKKKNLLIIPRINGLIISLIGLLLILYYIGYFNSSENISGIWLLLYNLLFKHGFHMALLTAIIFFFTGIIIFMLSYKSGKATNIAHCLVIFPFSIGYYVLMSYILGVRILYEIQSVQVAINTGIAFFFLSAAILVIRPESWLMKIFTGQHAGNQMARKLLPGLMLLPLIIGFLRIHGEETGLFPSDVGVVIVAMSYTLSFIFLVWLTAKSVNIKDLERARNEALLAEAQQIARIGSWEWNIKTGELYWSDEMFRLFGEEKGKFVPTYDEFLLHLHPEDRSRINDITVKALSKGESFDTEYRVLTPGGELSHIAARANFVYRIENQANLLIGTALDITEVKNAEAKLQASKDRYATTLSSIGDAVIATDIEGRITFLNRIGEQITGWPLDEALNMPVDKVFHIINEHTRLKVDSPVDIVMRSGMIVGLANHTILVRKDGSEVPIDDSGAPIFGPDGKVNGVVLVFRDITERNKSEKMIYESEQRLRFHFENSPLAVVEWDSDYIVTQWSVEAEHLFGWTREETLGKPIGDLKLVYEEDITIVENTMKRLSGGQERTVVSTNRNYTKKGNIIETTWFNSVLINENGEMSSVMSLVLDITEIKAAEKQIRESQERFRSVLDNSQDVIYRLNLQTGKFEYISPSAEKAFGHPLDELVNMDARTTISLIHPDDLPYIQSVLAKMENTGIGNMEYRILTKNGDYRWISNHMSLTKDTAGRPLYRDGNVRDITAIRQAREDILAANEELTIFNKAMIGRELRIIELKKEVNRLCAKANLPPTYKIETE